HTARQERHGGPGNLSGLAKAGGGVIMRSSIALRVLTALCLVLCSVSAVAMHGFAPAFAQDGSKKPEYSPQPGPTQYQIPEPTPIPPRRERACEDRPYAGWVHRPAEGCGERRAACPCVSPCAAEAGEKCGAGYGPCGMRCRPCDAACGQCEADHDERCRPGMGGYAGNKGTALPPSGPLKIRAFALYTERSLRLGESDRV